MRALAPYTPSIYLPQSWGRFRQYPRTVRTPIPGANVMAGPMVWGSQLLNLDGGGVFRSSSNHRVPLLGLGNYLGQDLTSASHVAEDQFGRVRANWDLIALGAVFGMWAGYEAGKRRLLANRRRRR